MGIFSKKSFVAKRKAHLKLGRWGEDMSCELLRNKGFYILLRNFRTSSGELDIVALDGNTLVFVEVKTLAKIGNFRPINNYSYRQQKRNIIAAKSYLKQLSIPFENIRFDFIEVVGQPRHLSEIRHYCNFAPFPIKFTM